MTFNLILGGILGVSIGSLLYVDIVRLALTQSIV